MAVLPAILFTRATTSAALVDMIVGCGFAMGGLILRCEAAERAENDADLVAVEHARNS